MTPAHTRHTIRVGSHAVALATLLAVTVAPARAEGRLEARYEIVVVGLTVGKASLTIDLNDTTYTATASGRVSGAAKAVTSGEGQAAVRGTLSGARLAPQTYALQSAASSKGSDIRLAFTGGAVTTMTVEPPTRPAADRVAVTDQHLRGVFDPITAAVVVVPGKGNVMAAETCQRSMSVFDGRSRFDLALSFKRVEQVKAERGYAGPVLVCAVRYTPVAGHRAGSKGARLLADTRDIEVWLAPIEGTRALAPFRVLLPTSIGQATMTATQFVATPDNARAALTPPAR
jgi:type IV secretory pathway VirJ component